MMKTILGFSLLIAWSCSAQQATHSPKADSSRLAEEFRRLQREPPRIDAQTLQRMESLRVRLAALEAEHARKRQEERLRQNEMNNKPGDYWSPGELDRLRKRGVTGPKGGG